MVNIKFRPDPFPYSSAFTVPEHLDTIYIPTGVLKNTTRLFHKLYGLSPKKAKKAAEVYLEEIYPQILGHESAHLALGHAAQEEGLPISETMGAYHNPIVEEIEDVADIRARSHAIQRAQEESKERRL